VTLKKSRRVLDDEDVESAEDIALLGIDTGASGRKRAVSEAAKRKRNRRRSRISRMGSRRSSSNPRKKESNKLVKESSKGKNRHGGSRVFHPSFYKVLKAE
jgi:hypothetical protein